MKEAGVLIATDGEPLYWHTPHDRSVVHLPDSRPLWDVIWENRERLLGYAHTHPGKGVPSPSHTDLTTFSGIELALGRRLRWWIASADRTIFLEWKGPEPLRYGRRPLVMGSELIFSPPAFPEPPWISELRRRSDIETDSQKGREP